MPPRNLLACKSDDREQRAVVPGLRALSSRFTQGQAPDTCGCLYPWTPPGERPPAWRCSRRSPAWTPHPQPLSVCSGPTSSSAPPAQSCQAAATPSKGYWAAAPPSLGTCLGRGHPLPTSQTTPPSRLFHPAGHPCLCTPSPNRSWVPSTEAAGPDPGGGGVRPSRAPSPGFSCARRGRWCAHSLTSRARLRASVELHPAGRGRERRAVAPWFCTKRVPAAARGRDRSAGGTHTPPPWLPPPPSRAACKLVHPPRTAPPPAGGGVASAVRCQANRGRGLSLVCPAPRAAARPLAPARFSLGDNCRRTCE